MEKRFYFLEDGERHLTFKDIPLSGIRGVIYYEEDGEYLYEASFDPNSIEVFQDKDELIGNGLHGEFNCRIEDIFCLVPITTEEKDALIKEWEEFSDLVERIRTA